MQRVSIRNVHVAFGLEDDTLFLADTFPGDIDALLIFTLFAVKVGVFELIFRFDEAEVQALEVLPVVVVLVV